jgi:hypothetical protein
MRISTYALATNPKYANFNPFNWQGLAGQLGTKASKALSTPVGAAKLGAGIGAGVGAINYLGSDDKSIGNLAGQVGGGAALGGAAGYGGSKLKNAYQPAPSKQYVPTSNTTASRNISQTGTRDLARDPATSPLQRPALEQTVQQPKPAKPTSQPASVFTEQMNFLKSKGVTDITKLSPQDLETYNNIGKVANSSRNLSPFANFKIRRYNGYIY